MRPDAEHPSRDELITSAANATIRFARSLQRKRVRQRERAILVEGVRSILAALKRGVTIRALLIDADRVDDIAPDLLATLRAAAQRVLLVDGSLFRQIAETEHPQPLIAVCDMPAARLPDDCTFVVALDGVRDPGNLGTLVRSSAAAGADAIALLPGTVDPYNAKALRASAGAIFAIPVAGMDSVEAIADRCFRERPLVALADAEAVRSYDELDWDRPVLLVIGGEAEGARETSRTYADVSVRIPMKPGIESLNAAVAGSILAFEIARQRRLYR